MFFDKKIKSLVEALKRPEIVGDQQFTGGRSAESRQLHMDESRFKECLFEFESTRNPQVLIDGMHYAYGRGQEVHFKLPRGGNQFTWKGAPDFNKVVYEKYFKKGSKNYIDYPLTDSGNIPDNRSFQAMVASGSYPVLKNNTVTWLKLLEPLLKEFEDKQMIASDRRQQIDTETGERISPDSFFYYIKSPATGKILLKQARVTVTPDGNVTPTPFSTAFDFRKPQNQAVNPKTGDPVAYKAIAGGIPFTQFTKTIFADQAKKDASSKKYPLYVKG